MRPLVHQFASNLDYLRAYADYRHSEESAFSIKRWAEELGFKNSGYLSNVLNGRRPLRTQMLDRLLAAESFSPAESELMQLQLARELSQSEAESRALDERIAELKQEPALLDTERFELITDWYHMVILEMVELRGFVWDHAWIAERLGYGLSAFQVEMAIRRLLRVGLLKVEGGTLSKAHATLDYSPGMKSRAIQAIHLQSIAMAKAALLEKPLSERDFNATTFSLHHTKLARLSDMMQEFIRQLWQLSAESDALGADLIMRMNLQSFILVQTSERSGGASACDGEPVVKHV